jgi:hypothetical protein
LFVTLEWNPRQALALVLGASRYTYAPKLSQGRAFYNSADDFYHYLTSAEGLSLPKANVAWFFDESRSPSDQLQQIAAFLQTQLHSLREEGAAARDLILYYVGHGLFAGYGHAYHLAIRETKEGSEGVTSIRVSDLAEVIKANARFLRRFLILDCCFSAAAYMEFQAGPLQVAAEKLLSEIPRRGTALLCSSSPQDPSLAPSGLPRTMFSDALIKALESGDSSLGPRMSISELGALVTRSLSVDYPSSWSRPEVHSPDQRDGDISGMPFFPNAAYAEAERFARGAAAQAERERQEREAAAQAERERQEREAAAQADRERQGREAAAQAERECREREAVAEKAERKCQEREAAEKAERERQWRLAAAVKTEREHLNRIQAEDARKEEVRLAKEQREKEEQAKQRQQYS